MYFWFSRHPRAEQRTQSSKVIAVHFAWAAKKRESVTAKHLFTGDRENVRRQSVIAALQGLLEFIR